MKKKKLETGVFATNKKVNFDYEIIDKFEAGIMLKGYEVKSIRAGKVNLRGAYASVFSDGPYVCDMHISAYGPANVSDFNPTSRRKLLLNQKEIKTLAKAELTKGLAIVALKIYSKKGLIKLQIGIGRGKKQYDKRESIKKRGLDIDTARALRKF